MEYHTTTSPLIQMFHKGHHGVKPSRDESRGVGPALRLDRPQRPRAGSWDPPPSRTATSRNGVANSPRSSPTTKTIPRRSSRQRPTVPRPHADPSSLHHRNSPWSRTASRRPATREGTKPHRRNRPARWQPRKDGPGDGMKLTLARIPAGDFVMGSQDGAADERPRLRGR